ncbi:hypothetical protein J2W83_004743 [Pseudomonas hunanensis]|uniref:Uncharacterized protein n=1 Tax=Pseudomonas hunanensis TaxID=1247546 RepID=A0ACC6K9I7_9PSED|nr:hypothetical protein [Pseudomonas hunanensis]
MVVEKNIDAKKWFFADCRGLGGGCGCEACRLGAYPFDVVELLAPSALTAGHFFSWKKVTKNRLLLHPALRCAPGSLAPVLLREDRAVRPLLGLSAFRPSMASTPLRKTSTRPPEVAGRSRARSRSTARATAGGSLRSRFVCLRAELWRGWAGLRPAICIGSTGLFAGQARSYRYCANFDFGAVPAFPRGMSDRRTAAATGFAYLPGSTPIRATAGESLRSRFVYLPADLWGGWQGCALRFALPVPASSRDKSDRRTAAPTGIAQILNSPQYRPLRGASRIAAPPPYRYCANFEFGANPVGAGLSREEARIPTTAATVEDNASPDAARNFATSGGRVEVLCREVEAMDGRKALRPRMGRTARSSRSKTGAREPGAQRRAGCRSRRFLVTFSQEKK